VKSGRLQPVFGAKFWRTERRTQRTAPEKNP
jgi:hypothetical protein